jgi:NitT/TauT family transport system substrate-binding protein
VITAEPDDGAYTNKYIQEALDQLGDLDTTGDGFTPIEVTLNEGGN